MLRPLLILALVWPGTLVAADPVATPKPLLDLPAHGIGSRHVQFSRDGKQLLSEPEVFGETLVWDVASGKREKVTRWPDSLSPDGKLAAWVQRDVMVVTEAATARELYRVSERTPQSTAAPGEAFFSPDGKTLYYSVAVPTLYSVSVWLRACDAATGENRRDVIARGNERMCSPRFSPDGKAFATSQGKDVLVFDAAAGKHLHTLAGHAADVTRVAWSADGKTIASAATDRTIRLWDTATNKTLHALEGHTAAVNGLAFAPDGKHLLTASDDETLRVWDTTTGKEVAAYKPLTPTRQPPNAINGRGIIAMAASPDGKLVAIGGYDRNVKVWEVAALVPKAK